MEQYESIREKLRKLLALAEKGVGGESDNARRLFDKMCQQYGLKPEDFMECEKPQWHTFKVGKSKMLQNLFARCAIKLGLGENNYYKQGASWELCITKLQAVELESMYEWHKSNFEDELERMHKDFMGAYVYKHNLYKQSEEENADVEFTPEDYERAMRQLALARNLSSKQYQKQLDYEK